MKQNVLKIIKKLSNLITIVALGYIVYRLYLLGIDPTLIQLTLANTFRVILIILTYYTVILLTATYFWNNLHIFTGKKVRFFMIFELFTTSNLYKYLPGNIMHFLGRNTLSLESKLKQKHVTSATLLEIFLNISVTTIISLFLGYTQLKQSVVNLIQILDPIYYVIFFLFMAILSIVSLFVINKYRKTVIELLSLFRDSNWYLGVLIFIFNYFANGITFILVLHILSTGPIHANYIELVVIFNISWLIGFITPGSPGGIGIREFLLLFFLESTIGENILLTALVLHRLIIIITEVVSFASGKLLSTSKAAVDLS